MARSYENSVFVNCPFDSEYRPLFEAVTFSIYDCGFFPRCALETDDSTQVRMEKIASMIERCRLAVHDISRTEPDASTGLPRFNMPFELGIFVGAKLFGARDQRRKAALVLEARPFEYQKYLSDIAGQDIRSHRGTPREAIARVRDFLSHQCDQGTFLPGGARIAERYEQFRSGLERACRTLHLDPEALTFRDLTHLIVQWMALRPLAPEPTN